MTKLSQTDKEASDRDDCHDGRDSPSKKRALHELQVAGACTRLELGSFCSFGGRRRERSSRRLADAMDFSVSFSYCAIPSMS